MPKLNFDSKGIAGFLILMFVVAASTILAGGIAVKQGNLSITSNTPVIPDLSKISPNGANTLQLQTFGGITITPTTIPVVTPPVETAPPPPADVPPPTDPVTPSDPCYTNTEQAMQESVQQGCICHDLVATCQDNLCVQGTVAAGGDSIGCTVGMNILCDGKPSGTSYCYAKPVIYLYPTRPTSISIKIQTTGKIVISDPIYKNGWDDVLAFPDGKLIYKNKAYSELFYETDNKGAFNPSNGIIVETQDIKQSLYDLTTSLGLIKSEQDELVDYWAPRLKDLNKKYILISLIDKQTKEETDKVLISPEPDTRIEFLLYFKGLDTKQNIPSLSLPPTPKRIGFTAVEWGGTIDSN